jgi:hypothetical protein
LSTRLALQPFAELLKPAPIQAGSSYALEDAPNTFYDRSSVSEP